MLLKMGTQLQIQLPLLAIFQSVSGQESVHDAENEWWKGGRGEEEEEEEGGGEWGGGSAVDYKRDGRCMVK
jgi:hypothetical protein